MQLLSSSAQANHNSFFVFWCCVWVVELTQYFTLTHSVLFDGPNEPKCDKDLVQCFDKYFNTFELSVLKTITIQSDLTWQPFILSHISVYFQPIIPLLTCLQKGIILPLSTDNDSNVHHKVDFMHDMFISAIIETLFDLSPGAWIPVDQEGDNGDDSEPHADHHETKSDLADLASEVNSSPIDTPRESSKSISSYPLNVSILPPMLPRPAPYQPSVGPGFYSMDWGLARHHSTREDAEDMDDFDFPQKHWWSSSCSASSSCAPSLSFHTASNPILHNQRGQSTGSMPQCSACNSGMRHHY